MQNAIVAVDDYHAFCACNRINLPLMRDVEKVNEQLVSVVILTWNRKEDIRNTLEKLRSVDYSPLEVIVVDNGSTDGTDGMILREFPEVKYFQQPDNFGIAGYNVGFGAAVGRYVVALDSDSWPAKDAITKMAKIFAENPRVGAVAFDVHSTDMEDEISAHPPSEVESEVFGYHGAGVGFRKEVFATVGYWYEPFFLYFNEMDHALGLLCAGYKIIHSTGIVAFHKSSSSARVSDSAAYYYARNALWLIWRRYPLRRMFYATFYFIYLAVCESVYQRTTVYLRALRDAFRKSAQVLAEREPLGEALFKKVRLPLPLVFSRWA